MKTLRFVASAIVALGLGVGGYVALSTFGRPETAPSVAFTRLDGSRSSVDALRGKVVLVNFWATSCTTCMHEMPQLVATHEKFKNRDFQTLSVAMSYDPPAYVINYAETRKLPFEVAIDNTGAIARSFGDVQLTPTTVVIDKRGQIVKRYVGEPDFVALQQLVEKLLTET